jgi:tRNA (guanine-N7-)-methyltransferase
MRQSSHRKLLHGRRITWDTGGVLLNDALACGGVDLRTIFGNSRPVELEIGTGKGTFLLGRAGARPEVNVLGLEYARSYCCYAADRCRRAGLTNARLIVAEAFHFFKVCLADNSIWRAHIYFPDPWPKRRHYHRRLIQPAFIQELRRTLRPGGQLLIVTDHIDYFHQIALLLNDIKGFASIRFPKMAHSTSRFVDTNFERKYIAQGRAFYAVAKMRYY